MRDAHNPRTRAGLGVDCQPLLKRTQEPTQLFQPVPSEFLAWGGRELNNRKSSRPAPARYVTTCTPQGLAWDRNRCRWDSHQRFLSAPRKTTPGAAWSRGGALLGLENRPGSAPGRGRAMADALTERTALLLADYLEYCAREPGTAGRPPSTPEASVLRSVAAQVQQRNHQFLSQYRDYRGNRVELVAQTARELAEDRGVLSWGRVVALVTFAGTLLERTPRGTDGCPKPGPRREADVDPDCRSMVALLCGWLSGQHGAWLEASGGWDGFCRFFTPMLPSPWRRGLAQVLLSGFMAAMLVYFWKKSLPCGSTSVDSSTPYPTPEQGPDLA
nr:bcl-2-like protein 10 [Manis javanica]